MLLIIVVYVVVDAYVLMPDDTQHPPHIHTLLTPQKNSSKNMENRANKVKKSRLKASTKQIYNDVLKKHFKPWLCANKDNVIVKLFPGVFSLNPRNEDGFTMNGKKFVRMMENDDNIITEYILDRRLNHYWKKGQSGINHFNHLRSAFKRKLRLTKTYYSVAADENLEDFFEGLANENADKGNSEGWESKATAELPFDVFCSIAMELMESNILCWTMLLLQWHLVCRGIDLEKINLNHISWEGDMLIIYFTHGKRDQQRKKLRKTRIKANHEMPHICCVTALTVYLMTRAHDGLELFEGGAVNKFYERGLKVALDSPRVKETLMRNGIDNANKSIHTIRKSAASHLAGGNGVGVSVLGILLRGGWSIGNVLNRYIKSGKHTDAMIANLLAGLDYMSHKFSLLPSHWKEDFALDVVTINGMFCVDGGEKFHSLFNKLVPSVVKNLNYLKNSLDARFTNIVTMNNLIQYTNCLGPDFAPSKSYFMQASGMLCITPIHKELQEIKEEIKKNRRDGITAEECEEIIQRQNTKLLENIGVTSQANSQAAVDNVNVVNNNIYMHGIIGSNVQKVPRFFVKNDLKALSFQQQLLLFLLHNKEKKLTALCHVGASECAANNADERKKFRRMTSVLHAFVAYCSHNHRELWVSYMSNPNPANVNCLYKKAWKEFAMSILSEKPANWKKWNKISASYVAQHKNFKGFCDDLMGKMGLELPKNRRETRVWRIKFPMMSII